MQSKSRQAMPPQAIAEMIFDSAYLLFVLTAGAVMLFSAQGNKPLFLYGVLAVVLGGGDAFHLLPRILGSLHGDMESRIKSLGFGKLVTSITMTVFYLLLYLVWAEIYQIPLVGPMIFLLPGLAAVRILLSLCPQNRWFSADAPLNWAIFRNIPFLMIGFILIALFASTASAAGDGFRFMPVAITLSFLFYAPVVLFSKKYPAVGALMMPKTAAYVWIVCMGFSLM